MKYTTPRLLALSVGLAITTATAGAATAELTYIDDLLSPLVPSTVTYITVNGASADGRVLTGELITGDGPGSTVEAYRWSEKDGLVMLGSLSNDQPGSVPFGISGDGKIVAGDSPSPDGNGSTQAFQWNSNEGMVGAGYLPGRQPFGSSTMIAASHDGSVITGNSNSGDVQEVFDQEAFRWTATTGMVGLGTLPGGIHQTSVRDISGNGSVIVGNASASEGETFGFRWTQATGMVSLGRFAPEHDQSLAEQISADGRVIVGTSDDYDTDVRIAYRWTETDGMVALNTDPSLQPEPRGLIDNGDVIVGSVWVPTEGRVYGFVWDEGNGMRNIYDVLVNDYAMDPLPAGTSINSINGISDDGTLLWGLDFNESASSYDHFIVRIIHDLPVITNSPVGQSVANDSAFMLSVEADGENLYYQWQIDGVDYPGATESRLEAPSAQHFHNGSYTVVVSNTGGSVSSAAVDVTVAAAMTSDSRLLNLSTRALSQTGGNVLIPGFVLSGTGSKQLLIRAAGPTLADFGVTDSLEDPELTLSQWDTATTAYVVIQHNDDWEDAANAALNVSTAARVGAFPLSEGSADASILTDLEPGQYSAVAGGKNGGTGVAIVELYDADDGASTCALQNISNRGYVGAGDNIMIPGFTISEEGPKTLLIRAVGPALEDFGVANVLPDPQLTIFRRNSVTGEDEEVLQCDNWDTLPGANITAEAATAVGAFPLATGSTDAAFVVTLEPGIYTVQASGIRETVGTALVEVYVVP